MFSRYALCAVVLFSFLLPRISFAQAEWDSPSLGFKYISIEDFIAICK